VTLSACSRLAYDRNCVCVCAWVGIGLALLLQLQHPQGVKLKVIRPASPARGKSSRLVPGCQLVALQDHSNGNSDSTVQTLRQLPYGDVIARLKAAGRPLTLRFEAPAPAAGSPRYVRTKTQPNQPGQDRLPAWSVGVLTNLFLWWLSVVHLTSPAAGR
jgi:hypothetical protein